LLSSVRHDSSSIDFGMVDFGNFDELIYSHQDADMGVENEWMETYFLPLRNLMDDVNLAVICENIAKLLL
jgi:hypothetical protein